jgi:hypothetical protein
MWKEKKERANKFAACQVVDLSSRRTVAGTAHNAHYLASKHSVCDGDYENGSFWLLAKKER